MRIGIIQSCYVPWRGFFDFIDSVDLFVIFDDVRYPMGRSWRNRNQVKTAKGPKWITVPVVSETRHGPIDRVVIADDVGPWREEHLRSLHESLHASAFYHDALDIWEEGVSARDNYLSALNVRLIRLICDYLKINTPIAFARDFKATGAKTDRLIELCRKTGATCYLSGPTAKGYIDERSFLDAGIALEYKTYVYPAYPQPGGAFMGSVSVLDLIANCGPDSRKFLKSTAPSEIAVTP